MACLCPINIRKNSAHRRGAAAGADPRIKKGSENEMATNIDLPPTSDMGVPDDADLTAAAEALREHLAQAKTTTNELSRLQREIEALRDIKNRFEREAAEAKADCTVAKAAAIAAEAKLDAAIVDRTAARNDLAPKDATISLLNKKLETAEARIEKYHAFLRDMRAQLTPPISSS